MEYFSESGCWTKKAIISCGGTSLTYSYVEKALKVTGGLLACIERIKH